MKKALLAALIISAQFGKSAGMNNEEFDEFIRKTLYENVGAPQKGSTPDKKGIFQGLNDFGLPSKIDGKYKNMTNTGEFLPEQMQQIEDYNTKEKLKKIANTNIYFDRINFIVNEYSEILSPEIKNNFNVLYVDFYGQIKRFIQNCLYDDRKNALVEHMDNWLKGTYADLPPMTQLSYYVCETTMAAISANMLNSCTEELLIKAFENGIQKLIPIANEIYRILFAGNVFKEPTNEKQILAELAKVGCSISGVRILPMPHLNRQEIPISEISNESKKIGHTLEVDKSVAFAEGEASGDLYTKIISIPSNVKYLIYYTSNGSTFRDDLIQMNSFHMESEMQQRLTTLWHEVGHENMLHWICLFKLLQFNSNGDSTLTETDKNLAKFYTIRQNGVDCNKFGGIAQQLINDLSVGYKKQNVEFNGKQIPWENVHSHILKFARTPEGIVSFTYGHDDKESLQIMGMNFYNFDSKTYLFLFEWSDFELAFRSGLPIRIGHKLVLDMKTLLHMDQQRFMYHFLKDPLYFFSFPGVHFNEELLCLVHGKEPEEIADYKKRVNEFLKRSKQLGTSSSNQTSKFQPAMTPTAKGLGNVPGAKKKSTYKRGGKH